MAGKKWDKKYLRGWDRRHPDVSQDRVRDLYEAGFSLKQIEDITGVPDWRVRRSLVRQEVELRNRTEYERLPHEVIAQTAFMYERMGLSVQEIAEHYGVARSTVQHRLKRHGVKMRTKGESTRLRFARRPKRRANLTWAEQGRAAYRKGAPAEGLEPPSTDQQSVVLPLNDAGEEDREAA